jgi:hypothetical protein
MESLARLVTIIYLSVFLVVMGGLVFLAKKLGVVGLKWLYILPLLLLGGTGIVYILLKVITYISK